MTSYMSMSGIPMTSQDILEHASRLVDKHLQADNNYSDLSDLLKVTSHTQPTVSGLHDSDYPSLSDPKTGLGPVSEVSAIRKIPLPPDIVELFQEHCSSLVGLFPEIKRAYVCIDSDIFVWKFENGRDVAYFDGLSETILSAGLIKPKRGIFQPHIQYLLCLATPVDIVLLGVSFARPYEVLMRDVDHEDDEMHLLPDPLFCLPTDGTYITTIAGTENGRIFMASKDGCLYELAYQAEDGWFSRKCRLVNHSTSTFSFLMPKFLNTFSDDDSLDQITIDESRHIIYTRSEKGTIQVYDLGDDGMGMSRVAAVSQQTTMQNAAHIARTIDRSNFNTIIHIAAIPKSESVNVHLVAVTHTGVRLYFTTTPFNSRNKRPSMLSLVHVRLPPGFTASATTQRPSRIHKAHYNRGSLVIASNQSEQADLLWTLSADTFPFHSQLMETFDTCPVNGPSWAMSEVPTRAIYGMKDYTTTKGLDKSEPPLVVTQHVEPIRKFVLLSQHGCHLMDKYHPVNQLQELLERNRGPDNEEVKAFFTLHGEDQACATCLILACLDTDARHSITEWATRAFLVYGGKPKPTTQMSVPTVSNVGPAGFQSQGGQGLPSGAYPPNVTMYSQPGGTPFAFTPGHGLQPQHMSTPNPGYGDHYMYGQPQMMHSPYSVMQTGPPAQAPVTDVTFSGKHNGICIYFSRIIRPLWECKVISDVPYQSPAGVSPFLASRCEGPEISWHLGQLEGLKDFMDANSQFVSPIERDSSVSGYTSMQQSRLITHYQDNPPDDQQHRKLQAEAQSHENASLQYIQQLVHRAHEVLGLWKIITDHQFHIVASGLTKDQQNQLKSMTFRNLVVNGKEMCYALITCLINRYLDDNATVDAISSRLREICPSLYSSEDATCSKANEILKAAKIVHNKQEKEKMLAEALHLYKNVTSQLDLAMVCSQFATVRYFDGIVDLCLAAADKRDPQQIALHFYKNGARAEDMEGREAYIARLDAYKRIIETLEYLMSITSRHPQGPGGPRTPGTPQTPDPNQMSTAEAEQYSERILQLGLRSTDELFHVELYGWLVKHQLTEKLLEIQSPFLEPYLKREAMFAPEDLKVMDLLWKHYEKTKNYSAAAKIQAKLADRVSKDILLPTRIEYLSRAIICAKSSAMHSGVASEGEFLHELEEKMEVARLQLQVMETLQRWTSELPDVRDALSRLNSELLDITALYSDFACPFSLAECKLAIVHCASHYDQTLIESIWTDIIEKELIGTASLPPQARMNTISKKVIGLGQLYVSTERYFPIAFLVKYLEKRSCLQSFDIKWVFTILQHVGVKLAMLQEVYDRLFKSKDPFWEASKKPLHLLQVICMLLTSFTDNPTQIPNYERRQFTTVCLDAISGYLVELQAMSSTDQGVMKLVNEFKGLQAKLDRLLP